MELRTSREGVPDGEIAEAFAGLTIAGGSLPPPQAFPDIFNRLMARRRRGGDRYQHQAVSLAEIADAWQTEDTGGKPLTIMS
ncbi:hypothetical protein [Streptomyces sp. NPDC058773]|uniref:hypothetical protein n=1 Tax=Streptomyces sp. NPDC058773 TaxID=3346632 RepID=UPI003688126F